MNRRRLIFVVVVLVAVGVAIGYVGNAARSSAPLDQEGGGSVRTQDTPLLVFQRVSLDGKENAHIGVRSLAGNRERLTKLVCERVYFAGGRGLCLLPRATLGWNYEARVFGPDFRVQQTISLPGINSRARVSPDGRYGAATGFVNGHSYADESFSTQTFILDLVQGEKVANLEDFAVYHEGRKVTAVDRNFWGVTFTSDSNRFYATMATGGKTYLVVADLRRRTGRTLHENVECPSLSPDGTRIAYKRAVPDRGWLLTVLDLKTGRETATAESRSVDDQAEWLDNEHVLYGQDGAIWTVPADGSGTPEQLLDGALSPAVVRGSGDATPRVST